MRHKTAKIGDIINGWKILDIFIEDKGYQNISMAKIQSTVTDEITITRLTRLTNNQIGRADGKRPDVSKKNIKHGQHGTRLYRIWRGMRARCTYPSQAQYKNYGGKGIKVCPEWDNSFENFYKWAISHEYNDKLSIDRIDNEKDYCPENCRWATAAQQNSNRGNSVLICAFGESKTLDSWSLDVRCKCSYGSLCYRIKNKWEPEVAITTPSPKGRGSHFRRYKSLYKFLQEKYPQIIDEFISLYL